SAEEGVFHNIIFSMFNENTRHFGWEKSWSKGVHVNIMLSPFSSQIFCKCHDGSLTRVISDCLHEWMSPSKSGNRSDVNDFPFFLINHYFPNLLTHQKRTIDIHIHDLFPGLLCSFLNWSGPCGTTVIHEDINFAKMVFRPLHYMFHVFNICDVTFKS